MRQVVLLLGHAQLQVHQLAEAIGHRVDLLVQLGTDELLERCLVAVLQDAREFGYRLVGGLQQRLEFVHQCLLLGHHRSRGIAAPAFADIAFRHLHAAQTFLPAQHADTHLVRGVDDVHRIAIGDQFQVFQGHDPVVVDRFQALVGITHSQHAAQAYPQQEQDENPCQHE
ncbi:hypothetical protein D9M69_448590 [compost metagenome]